MDPKTLEALIELEDTKRTCAHLRAENERLASKVNMFQALRTADLKDYEEMATQLRTLRVEFDIYVQETQR